MFIVYCSLHVCSFIAKNKQQHQQVAQHENDFIFKMLLFWNENATKMCFHLKRCTVNRTKCTQLCVSVTVAHYLFTGLWALDINHVAFMSCRCVYKLYLLQIECIWSWLLQEWSENFRWFVPKQNEWGQIDLATCLTGSLALRYLDRYAQTYLP